MDLLGASIVWNTQVRNDTFVSSMTYRLSHHTISPPANHSMLKTYCSNISVLYLIMPKVTSLLAACNGQSVPRSAFDYPRKIVPEWSSHEPQGRASYVHRVLPARDGGTQVASMNVPWGWGYRRLEASPACENAKDYNSDQPSRYLIN
jgi:hypothetical protein